MPQIRPPDNLTVEPDRATAKGVRDMTGDAADERVLFINLKFFRYGIDDKVHAAAVLLSFVLMLIIVGVIIRAGGETNQWNDKVFTWLTNTFLFVAGIALGKSGDGKSKSDD